MDGGIRAWNGLTAEGPPEAGVAYFTAGTGPAEMASLAWALEEGTRRFYAGLSAGTRSKASARVFASLIRAEEHHEETLAGLHGRFSSEPVSGMYDRQETPVIEGGMELEAALKWAGGKQISEVLDLALGQESNAYDRYLKMLNISTDEPSKEVFRAIAREEKGHLKRLADLMDEEIKNK
jgi:rubrerythrin